MKRRTLRKAKRAAKLIGIAAAAIWSLSSIITLTAECGGYDLGTLDPKNYEITKGATIEPEITETPECTQTPELESTEVETRCEAEQRGLIGSMDWDADDAYLLAKIAMAEAEGEDTEGKALVILVVLNRVWSDSFPGTIEEVILQNKPSYQFSVTQEGGRWWRVEPDEDCYKALRLVESGWNESQNALYFESQSKSTWHQDNLEYLFQHGKHYFYKEKE